MSINSTSTSGQGFSLPDKIAFTIAEFAKLCGKTATWGHRLKYAGKLKVQQGLGCDLVPRAEVLRIMNGDTATTVPQKSNRGRKAKQDVAD